MKRMKQSKIKMVNEEKKKERRRKQSTYLAYSQVYHSVCESVHILFFLNSKKDQYVMR